MDDITTPYEPDWSKAVYHLYVIRTRNREALQAHLAESGIASGLHYPIPLHLQNAYKTLGYKEGDFPVSEEAAREIVSLPMYPGLTVESQRRVAEEIARWSGAATSQIL